MFAKLIDRIWPKVCMDEFREHCFHFRECERRLRNDLDCLMPKKVSVYTCCRCHVEKLDWWHHEYEA